MYKFVNKRKEIKLIKNLNKLNLKNLNSIYRYVKIFCL